MVEITQQEHRIQAISQWLSEQKIETLLDLGCGSGDIIFSICHHTFLKKIVGVDLSSQALSLARERFSSLEKSEQDRIQLINCCMTELEDEYKNFDAALLIETIEHIDPHRLSVIEKKVFSDLKPSTIVITTPNKDYNFIHGLSDKEFRHPDHRFEWGREKFRKWSQGLALRNQYQVTFSDIGPLAPRIGSSTQMALFKRV